MVVASDDDLDQINDADRRDEADEEPLFLE